MYKLKIWNNQETVPVKIEFVLPELRDACEVIDKLRPYSGEDIRFYVTRIKENKDYDI